MLNTVASPSALVPAARLAVASPVVPDAVLLRGYDPATSLAWLGAEPHQLTLFELETASAASDDAEVFRREGFTVRPLVGAGSLTQLAGFCRAHHYLRTPGRQPTIAFGLFTRVGELVGVASYTRHTNEKAAAAMFPAPDGVALSHHFSVNAHELLVLSRLTLMDAVEGASLGRGAESYFVRATERALVERNRSLWRAIRMAELGLATLSPVQAAQHFAKVIVTFADKAQGHSGTIYRAAGFYTAGETRAERVHVGLRSGQVVNNRLLAKLRDPGSQGHLSNVLRAIWEGDVGDAVGCDTAGREVAHASLDGLRLVPVPDWRVLAHAWRAWVASAALPGLRWTPRYAGGGFRLEARPCKARFILPLGTPAVTQDLARRCVHLRARLLAADARWSAEENRWPRGLGWNWRRRPTIV